MPDIAIHSRCPDCNAKTTTKSGICQACVLMRIEQRDEDDDDYEAHPFRG